MLRGIVTLIVFAIVLQNTCPYGYAGKTAVAAPHVHHCPLKDHQPQKSGSPDNFTEDFKNLNHAYVFSSEGVACGLKLFGPAQTATTIAAYGHEDAFLIPPLRPPRFTSPVYA
jgi:hypothetical protein